ncbi:Alpha/Beta hydrolase fold [Phytophthora cactorum]|nr:Alpha/Beta hydrolase fold [Phytophthora cactorum]
MVLAAGTARNTPSGPQLDILKKHLKTETGNIVNVGRFVRASKVGVASTLDNLGQHPTLPVLAFFGCKDPDYADFNAEIEGFKAAVPHAQCFEDVDGGHYPHLENPERVVKEIEIILYRDYAVTLKHLQRLSDEGRTEELQDAIAACRSGMLRTFCLELGLRVGRRKYVAYQSKAGFSKLLIKKLAMKTTAKRRDVDILQLPPPSKKQSYLHLLHGPRKMKKRAANAASIDKAARLLKELFPKGSRAAAMVDAELARCLTWFADVQREEDE